MNEVRICHDWQPIDNCRQQCAHCKRIIGISKRTGGIKLAIVRKMQIQDEKVYKALRKICPHSRVYTPAISLEADIANILYELRYRRGWSANKISWKSGIEEAQLVKYVYKHDWFPGKAC